VAKYGKRAAHVGLIFNSVTSIAFFLCWVAAFTACSLYVWKVLHAQHLDEDGVMS
jgi:hypothetical protein